jgi:hypothetical protein
MDLKDEEIKTKKVHIAKSSSRAPKHHYQRSKSDSDKGVLIKYHRCGGDHAFRFCD